ncbi:MAG: hypothetical protein J5589_05945 [Firmicutes bacterium]|nr:hypothetical protein [Bacillota bacterium]
MAKRKKKKKTSAGLVILVVLLVLAALFLGYMVLSQKGLISPLPFLDSILSETRQEVDPASESLTEETKEAVTTEEETEEGSEEITDDPEEESEEDPHEGESAVKSTESVSAESSDEEESSEEDEISEEESSNEDEESSEDSQEPLDIPYYYYTDIVPNILSAIEMGNMADIAPYVGEEGLRLCPTGVMASTDVTLSRDDLEHFMELPTTNYGISASSGKDLILTPAEYLTQYISPVNMDFAASKTLTDDEEDLALAAEISGAKTVSFYDTPSVIEWHKVILVFSSEGTPTGGDVLRAIIYKDMTTY